MATESDVIMVHGRVVEVMKAQGSGPEALENVAIVIRRETPTWACLDEQARSYDAQADELADVLFGHLPGGLLDRLIARLLSRKVSALVVSHAALERRGDR